MNIREALNAILSKSMKTEDVFAKVEPQERLELEWALADVLERLAKNTDCAKSESYFEIFKYDANGQWKMEKAAKPGPTLNYSKINPRDNASVNPEAKKLADTNATTSEAGANTIDYQNDRMKTPKMWAGAAERAKQVKDKIAQQANEPALETIARRQKLKKGDGILEDEETKNKERMIAKNEMLGYGPAGAPSSAMTMSEKDEGSPEHESAEKKKAKKIKDKAQELLDMHKE
jgi:hypothetical protein